MRKPGIDPFPRRMSEGGHGVSARAFALLFFFFFVPASFLFAPCAAHASTLSRPGNNLGLVMDLPFDESSGAIAHDYSGYGNNASLTNGAAFVSGKSGNAFSVGASNGAFNVPNSASLSQSTALTISFWIDGTPSSFGFAGILIKDNATAGWQIQQNNIDSHIYLRIDTSAGTNQHSSTSGVVGLDGAWHHFVYALNNGKYVIYKDGVSVETGTYSPGSGLANSNPLFGVGHYSSSSLFLDDIRLYDRAISAAEVASLYSSQAVSHGLATLKQGPSNSGLVGWWKFDEGAGNVARDSSGLGNNATLVNAPAWVAGRLGKALQFDGSTNYVKLASLSTYPTTSITVSAWVKLSVNKNWSNIVSHQWTSRNGTWILFIDSTGAARFGVYNGAATTYPKAGVTPGVWHHIVGEYDGTNITVYVDGVGTTPQAISTPPPLDTSGEVDVSNLGSTAAVNGLVDDVRIYNRALSAAEVAALYKAGETKLQTSSASLDNGTSLGQGLVGLWTFDGNDVTANGILDQSGNGNTGWFIGGATSTALTIGKLGQAMKFNGSTPGTYVSVPNSTPFQFTSSFSVSLWIRVSTASITSTYYGLMGVANTTQTGWDLGITSSSGKARMTIRGTSIIDSFVGPDLRDGKWHHLAVVSTLTSITTYVDGASVGVVTGTWTPITNTQPLSIGNRGLNTYSVLGSIDDVRIYNRALSAAEVKQLYLMGK